MLNRKALLDSFDFLFPTFIVLLINWFLQPLGGIFFAWVWALIRPLIYKTSFWTFVGVMMGILLSFKLIHD